jgi:RNA polymerase sigma-70 factor (ECF subfamily)
MDADLVRSAQSGNRSAFAALVQGTLERLLNVAHRILRDAALAEDATQQALLRAWRDLPDLKDPERFEAWVYRLLLRACYDEARQRRRWLLAPRTPSVEEPRTPDDGLNVIVDRDQLERGLAKLSVDHRAVLVLHYYLDLPLERVAETLDVPIGTVYSRLHRAQRSLRGAIEADARPLRRSAAEGSTR